MRSKTSPLALSLPLILVGACAHGPGTAPEDMSAAEHIETAQAENEIAAEHAAKYDPAATEAERKCMSYKEGACWTSTTNPTEEHQDLAEKHRQLAAQHRSASKELRRTEASRCAGIDEADRDMSPFAHREDIQSVSPVWEESYTGKVKTRELLGAKVVFRAVPGMTTEWLQRVVDCHLARNATLGFDQPGMFYCPLNLPHVDAVVRSTGNGFSITVRSDDPETAKKVLRRAHGLMEQEPLSGMTL